MRNERARIGRLVLRAVFVGTVLLFVATVVPGWQSPDRALTAPGDAVEWLDQAVTLPANQRGEDGSRDSRLQIWEFSDFSCPFCARHARTVLPVLKARYVDTSQVMYRFRHLPLTDRHPDAERAAQISVCAADQGNFWAVHDQLFVTGGGPILAAGDGKLRACVESAPHPQLADDRDWAKRLRVTSTPTFIFVVTSSHASGSARARLVGAHDLKTFEHVIQRLLGS